MESTTAHGKFSYNRVIKNKSLFEHACLMDKHLCSVFGWGCKDFNPINPFIHWGVEINACRIGEALERCDTNSTLEQIAESMHTGWKDCFKFWRDSKPWEWISEFGQRPFLRPSHPLSANDKEERANQSFQQLDEKQKRIALEMARYVKEWCL